MARIMIAEDDDSVRAFVKRALEMDGHEVDEAGDGADALSQMASGNHDLLLSDICMPELDGIALARRVAGQRPDLPIVLMTGYAEQREGAEELGSIVREVVPKPFSLARIRASINEALSAKVD